jgi:molecular chaperone HtpG
MSLDLKSRPLAGTDPERWDRLSGPITVGKDILELLSSSMYISPLSIYREYIQNAADAIDEARAVGVLKSDEAGRVDIMIDRVTRTFRIRDNGVGLDGSRFVDRLTSFGASAKRGRGFRGFRGVGRLAGIGYAQELIFRARGNGDQSIRELRWDCRKLKELLRSENGNVDLEELVFEAVTVREAAGQGWPSHFFEVEVRGIVRHKNDHLLDPDAISAYLAQVAPVPFSPTFIHAGAINDAVGESVNMGEVEIFLPDSLMPVYRPYRQEIDLGGGKSDAVKEIELINIPSLEGGTAAIGWVLHHGYTGALPGNALVKGLRLRVGNVQIGDERLLDDVFPESRFNGWCIGEIHVVDPRVIPNGRRDHFEQNAHYGNLLTHLTPVARNITRRCRTVSIQRNRLRECLRQLELAKERVEIIKQGTLPKREQARLLRDALAAISVAERLRSSSFFGQVEGERSIARRIDRLRRQLDRIKNTEMIAPSLGALPAAQRNTYQQVFSMIYECAPNRTVAKAIIDRIMDRLGSG